MKLIGIIGAMEVEVASLKEMMTDVTIRTKASMEFNHGYLNGKEVVVVRSGIGKVNAGICTQILVDDYGVDCVINTGIAGSLRNEINIGDIVISTDAVQHDMDVRIFGYPLGEIPQMGVLSFPADEHLAEVAEEVCKEVNPEIQVFRGRVVSGDQFISSKEVKNHLIEEFTRFVTRPISSTISIASNLRTSAVISGLSVKSGIIKPEPSTIAVSMQTATHTPTNAARFVPLSHSSSSPAPMCQPVMIAFACASAAPTQ